MKKTNPAALPPQEEPAPETSDQELAKVVPIRTETTLTRYPVHRIAKRGQVTIRETKKNERGQVTTTWAVKHPPGPLAYKLDTLVINRRIDEMRVRGAIPQLIKLGSLKEICRELELKESGVSVSRIRESLKENAGALITAKIDYRGYDGTERDFEFTTTRYTVIFTGEKLPNEKRADAVYIELHPRYHEMLKHSKTRPLDYEYLKQLSPAAQRLYELLSFSMFGTLTHGRPVAQMLYSEFCRAAPLTRNLEAKKMRSQMWKLHKPHIESGYIKGVEFEEISDEGGRPDWIIKYIPGKKARHEFRELTRKRLAESETKKPRLIAAKSTVPNSASKTVSELTTKLPADAEAQRLIADLTCYGVGETTARQLVEAHREEAARQMEAWPYRSKEGMKNPPGVLVKFIREAEPLPSGLLDARRKAEEVRREKAKRERREAEGKARETHEDAFRDVFEAYLGSELHRIAETNREAYSAFESDFDLKLGKTLRHISEPHRAGIRLAHWNQYITEHPELGVLTFWQWDAAHNSTPFGSDG